MKKFLKTVAFVLFGAVAVVLAIGIANMPDDHQPDSAAPDTTDGEFKAVRSVDDQSSEKAGLARLAAWEEEIKAAEAEENACRRDLQCWAKRHKIKAAAACYDAISATAVQEYRWLGPDKYRFPVWLNKEFGTIRYRGDEIRFQTAGGGWIRHKYECDFDPSTGFVIGLRTEPGRYQ